MTRHEMREGNEHGRAAVAARQDGGVTRLAAFGSIAGTLLGAYAGAALGFAVGGPLGAVVGDVLGGVAGLAFGDAACAGKRGLTAEEEAEARLVFGDALDYAAVRIAEAPVMAVGDFARTPFNTVYFPPGTSARPFNGFMPWLVHELTHVWQTQHGVGIVTKLLHAMRGPSAYRYGGEAALRGAAAEGKRFRDFNTEQQGDILRDYYVRLKAGADTSAYEPFVAEVKSSGEI